MNRLNYWRPVEIDWLDLNLKVVCVVDWRLLMRQMEIGGSGIGESEGSVVAVEQMFAVAVSKLHFVFGFAPEFEPAEFAGTAVETETMSANVRDDVCV